MDALGVPRRYILVSYSQQFSAKLEKIISSGRKLLKMLKTICLSLMIYQFGDLENEGQGRYRFVPAEQRPRMMQTQTALGELSTAQLWEVVRSLESIAFVQPNLEIIIQTLWEQLTKKQTRSSLAQATEPAQRIFIHLDYILSETMQEQVDTLQEQIKQLWRKGGGIIQFNYRRKDRSKLYDKTVTITVYPVCLHYARRAKYLSAYGYDPNNKLGWHNYRLDRIASHRLKLLTWKNPQIPTPLKKQYQLGTLPTVRDVTTALEEAWGFNFYLPKRLLIMRFPADFAHWYVEQTDRHKTFKSIRYKQLIKLVVQTPIDAQAQNKILSILSKRSPNDAYYTAWIRLGDINIVMRLRDWRPKGEVIAPLVLREKMSQEAKAELSHYQ